MFIELFSAKLPLQTLKNITYEIKLLFFKIDLVFLCPPRVRPRFHSFSTAICFRYIQSSGFQPHNSCGQLCLQP
jgi:hypothetical protein